MWRPTSELPEIFPAAVETMHLHAKQNGPYTLERWLALMQVKAVILTGTPAAKLSHTVPSHAGIQESSMLSHKGKNI